MNTLRLPEQSNASDFVWTFQLGDVTTGDAYDLSSVDDLRVSVEGQGRCTRLTGNIASGAVEIEDAEEGTISITFPASQMKDLTAGTYSLGLVLIEGGETIQIALGSLPIVHGHPK